MKTLFTRLTFFAIPLFCFLNSYAQPANDMACDAAMIVVDAGFVGDSLIGATVETDEVLPPAFAGDGACFVAWCDGPVLDGSAWWTFTAPSNGAVVITTCSENTGFDTQVAIWEVGDCSDFATYSYVAANDDMPEQCDSGGDIYASTLSIDGLTQGATYYIQVDGYDGAEGYYDISVSTGVPSTLINFVHNSADQTIPLVDIRINGDLVADDLEFLTCTGYIEVTAGDGVYITICDSESEDDSNPFYSVTTDINDSQDYVAIVYGIHAESGYSPSVPLQLALYEGALMLPSTSDNDLLFFHGSTDGPVVDVEIVELGNQTIYNNAAPGEFSSEGYAQLQVANYSIEVTDENGNSLGMSYCAPLAMFGGNFALTIVATGFVDPSQNSDGLPFGLYVVDHFNGVLFPLMEGTCPIPANNMACDAQEIIVDDPAILANNQFATVDQDEVSPPNLDINDPEADCVSQWCDGALNNSVWFSFTAPASGEVLITTCYETSFDTQVAVYSAGNCNDYGTFTYIAANDDTDGGCEAGNTYASTLQIGGLTAGTVYHIQVDGWGGEGGDFMMSVQSIVSVAESKMHSWKVFPNPANESLRISGISGKVDAFIYDVAGKLVISQLVSEGNTINVESLSPGIYTLAILNNGVREVQKVIIE